MKTVEMKPLQVNALGGKTKWKGLHWEKKFWLFAIGLFVLAAGGITGYVYYTKSAAPAAATATLQTSVARSGNLTIYASGTGTLVTSTARNVSFTQSGAVTEVLVKLGDQVTAGQVLARLQSSSSEAALKASVASAELSVLNAQKNLDDLDTNAQKTTANALKAVETAQAALDDLKENSSTIALAQQTVANAEDSLITAQYKYNISKMTASQASIDAYYAAMLSAQENYEKTVEWYNDNQVYNRDPDSLFRANAEARLSSARQALATATSNYNAARQPSTASAQAVAEANLTAAKADLAAAQTALEKAKAGPTAGEVAVAEANLAAAKAEYERVKDGVDPKDIAIAQASLDNAKAQLEVAKEKKAVEELTSPIAGTVMSINGSVGDSAGTNTFMVVANLSQPVLTAYLDESDLDKIKNGLAVEVTFDALPDTVFKGTVVEINPSLVSVSNVSAVEIKVQLDDTSTAVSALAIGMNAAVDVISSQALNAVLVPVEAVRSVSTDEQVVFVMENGEPVMKVVTVGLTNTTTAEIKSGVNAGDVVSTGVVQTKSTGN